MNLDDLLQEEDALAKAFMKKKFADFFHQWRQKNTAEGPDCRRFLWQIWVEGFSAGQSYEVRRQIEGPQNLSKKK